MSFVSFTMKVARFVWFSVGIADIIDDEIWRNTGVGWPPSDTTRLGCECKQSCMTSARFECNVADFCPVKSKDCANGTAAWSLTHGYYDWCLYPAYPPWESHTAQDKHETLLLNVNMTNKTSGEYPNVLNVLTGIIGESVMTTFDAHADVFPHSVDAPWRKKQIHSVGVTAGFKFESNGRHPFTGVFQGTETGIVRFSSAKQPGKGGFAPGMGMKFLRDGRESANFVAMYTLDGQSCGESNFFEHEWSNHIPWTDNFGLQIIAAKFWQASNCPLMVGLSDLATETADAPAAPGSFPFQLFFSPKYRSDCDCMDYDACLGNLSAIPIGSQLFEVAAIASPGAERQVVGNITLTSKLMPSSFGDTELFFEHQRMEDDFAIHPEWLEAISGDLKGQCGMTSASVSKPTIKQGCSSPFNTTSMLKSDLAV